ncbi:hypothetical protein INR75_17360 [Zunongwangia sp. SCSIO 43204]|uniref:hypothetical protein n=1 Tax=Zunongwangia sp. SCSIO 43204 TaxID=2779359 RepID=UPI001CAA1A4B|nr:hypothetical protein [Zunongwangia sp. SCSIO 43204]UAB83919.1 hypothetical protein INR75_17360 [Zunongwangia sp. SCSIO 43204]
MKKLFSLFLILFSVYSVLGQCDCDDPSTIILENIHRSSYTFLANQNYCIKGNVTIEWDGITFQNNTSICLSANSIFTTNDLKGNTNENVNINIGENASFIFAGDIPSSFEITIANGGVMKPRWGDLDINGKFFNLTIEEGGNFDYNTVNVNSSESVMINNFGNFRAGNLTVNNSSQYFRLNNEGVLKSSNFNIYSKKEALIDNLNKIEIGNLTFEHTENIIINNHGSYYLSLFSLKSGIENFDFTNSKNAEVNLTSHIHLGSGASNFINQGIIVSKGEIALSNEATLNLNNSGAIKIDRNFDWGESSKLNYLYNTGKLNVGGQMSSERCKLEFYNYEDAELTMVGHLTYGIEGPNKFENYGVFHADGLYSNDPTLHMKNEGQMILKSNYGDTEESFFSNCGTLIMENWFRLHGTIINTGNYNVPNGSITFEPTGRIQNYSVMKLKQIVMDPNSIFYNEGEVTFSEPPNTNIRFAGPGANVQPEHSDSSNYGRFKWPGTQSNQSGWARGNLNFVTTTPSSVNDNNAYGMFGRWNSVEFDSSVKFGNCNTCTVITEYDQCANADGTWPVIGPKCIPVNRHVRTYL